MESLSHDNLPPLTKSEALEILSLPISKLRLSSDYYKAAFHLIKFPCLEVKNAFLDLIQSKSTNQAVVIAKRKAVEGLARHGCVDTIPVIAKCLWSSDPYLVENAAWALDKLGCKDKEIHRKIVNLLEEPLQNRRVLIKSLVGMKAFSKTPKFKSILHDSSLPAGFRGAVIAAFCSHYGDKEYLYLLEEYLSLPNQNSRQCAITDVIDSGAIELLPLVLRTPVAPFFRISAIEALWPQDLIQVNALELEKVLDSIMKDHPCNLKRLQTYVHSPDNDFLISELFNTDFSHCYLALENLLTRRPDEIWPKILEQLNRAKKDYGALYFFMTLFRLLDGWSDDQLEKIQSLAFSCLDNKWPKFIKFRPAAILTLCTYWPLECFDLMVNWLDEEKTPFWVSRYSALISIQENLVHFKENNLDQYLQKAKKDSNRFVRIKADLISTQIDI